MPAPKDLKAACLRALSGPKSGRIKVIREGLESGVLSDPDLRAPLVEALADRSSVFADTLADEFLPQVRPSLVDLLEAGYDDQSEVVKFRRLRVLRKLNATTAKRCARRSIQSQHVGLAVESIEALTKSAVDSGLLMEIATERSPDRAAAAFSALGGIRKPAVIKFLTGQLASGSGAPHLAMAYHPHEKFARAIEDVLGRLIDTIREGEALPPGLPERLVSLLRAAAGQGASGLNDILTACLAKTSLLGDKETDYTLFQMDFVQAAAEAIATNPVEGARRELVQKRHEIGSGNLFYAMCAASHLDGFNLFDLFSPHLEEQNVRGRCRGWRCGCRHGPWPCSIVSAIEYVLALDRGKNPEGSPIPEQEKLVAKIRAEPRWEEALDGLPYAK